MAELHASYSYGEILKFLECPVCFETVYPPIFQCKNGHILCSRCKDRINCVCPICKVVMYDPLRSTILERFLPLIKFPCMYCTAGCNEIISFNAKQKHEKGCEYRPYKCPYAERSSPSCKTEGDIPTLLSHLQSSHRFTFKNQCVFEFQIYCNEDIPLTKGYKCFDQHFCLHFELRRSDRVYMAYLTIMGDETLATKYYYRLTITNGDTEKNWKGSPRSIRETKEDIWRSGNAFFMPQTARNPLRFTSFGIVVKGRICRQPDRRTSLCNFRNEEFLLHGF